MSDSFLEWTARLRDRDDGAARELFQRFTRQLIALAHNRFGAALKGKVDPEDDVQSAYKSFFRRYGKGKLELVGWHSLWGLLTVITLRKGAARVKYYRAECRDAAREAAAPPGEENWAPCVEALGREPTPLEAALLNEAVEQLLADLSEDDRPVIELSLQGYTTREISQRLGRVERTVRRVRERVRRRLERMGQEGI
jgi:RNA polymerase sigma-70 factor, ECF subfamily